MVSHDMIIEVSFEKSFMKWYSIVRFFLELIKMMMLTTLSIFSENCLEVNDRASVSPNHVIRSHPLSQPDPPSNFKIAQLKSFQICHIPSHHKIIFHVQPKMVFLNRSNQPVFPSLLVLGSEPPPRSSLPFTIDPTLLYPAPVLYQNIFLLQVFAFSFNICTPEAQT